MTLSPAFSAPWSRSRTCVFSDASTVDSLPVLPCARGRRRLLGVPASRTASSIERRWYRLRSYDLAILPPDGPDRLDVLHLSDLHFVRGDAGEGRFLAVAAAGRRHGRHRRPPRRARGRRVRGRGGPPRPGAGWPRWFVLGSNDYFVPKPAELLRVLPPAPEAPRRAGRAGPRPVAQLDADGWVDLTNSRRETALDGWGVELLGLDDAHIHWHDLRVAPRRTDRFSIAVMHSPDSAPETAALGYDLLVRRPHARRAGLPAGRRRPRHELLDAAPARRAG